MVAKSITKRERQALELRTPEEIKQLVFNILEEEMRLREGCARSCIDECGEGPSKATDGILI